MFSIKVTTLLLLHSLSSSTVRCLGTDSLGGDTEATLESVQQLLMSDGVGSSDSSVVDFEPSVISSISILEGKNAQLDCLVKNKGSHQVSWYHIDKQHLLTVDGATNTSNKRIKIVHERGSYALHIDSITLEDAGYYACRINTRPPKSQVKYLEVVIQPRFLDSSIESETNVVVKEHENASLSCKAIANPPPIVKWSREDGRPIILSPFSTSKDTITGEVLVLTQVSRWMSGSFICTVTSGISAPISRCISLNVNFPPMIMIPSQLVTIGHGYSVTLECHTESQPLARQDWIGPNGGKIVSSLKNSWKLSTTEHKAYSFKIVYKLTLYQVDQSDSGRYTCVAKNKLGVTRSSLTLQVIEDWKHSTTFPPSPSVWQLEQSESTTSKHFNSQIPSENSSRLPNISVSDDESRKPSEVFVNLSDALKNRTKTFLAHFSTNKMENFTPSFINFSLLLFLSLLYNL